MSEGTRELVEQAREEGSQVFKWGSGRNHALLYALADALLAAEKENERLGEMARYREDRADIMAAQILAAEKRAEEAGRALTKIAEVQPETVAMFRRRGIVFRTPLTKPVDELTEAERWEKVAFSIYADLCEADGLARAALAPAEPGE